jgi:hypothetical protein
MRFMVRGWLQRWDGNGELIPVVAVGQPVSAQVEPLDLADAIEPPVERGDSFDGNQYLQAMTHVSDRLRQGAWQGGSAFSAHAHSFFDRGYVN